MSADERLRGTAASIAVEHAGFNSAVVAGLGHESAKVTKRSYAKSGAGEGRTRKQAAKRLRGK